MGKHKVSVMRRVGDYSIVKVGQLFEIKRKTKMMFSGADFVSVNHVFNIMINKEGK